MQNTSQEIFLLVTVTVPSKRLARSIAKKLIDERIAACINILGPIESYYQWKGSTETSREYFMIAKTLKRTFPAFEKLVLELHPYECPCIVATRIDVAHEDYLVWIQESIRSIP